MRARTRVAKLMKKKKGQLVLNDTHRHINIIQNCYQYHSGRKLKVISYHSSVLFSAK